MKFQSTHPCGVRRYYGVEVEIDDGVSIHAPLRGATRQLNGRDVHLRGFNPRTPAGCDERY